MIKIYYYGLEDDEEYHNTEANPTYKRQEITINRG